MSLPSIKDLDLIAAVIEFTKDPAKYSDYLASIKDQLLRLEQASAKYKTFEDAEAYIRQEKVQIQDLRKLLSQSQKELKLAAEKLENDKKIFEDRQQKFAVQLEAEKEALLKYKNEVENLAQLQKDKYHSVEHDQAEREISLTKWNIDLTKREEKFNQRWTALQQLMLIHN